jgi:DNA polymerase II small subunit
MNKEDQEKLQKAVSLTISAGYQLEKDAFDFLATISKTEDPTEILKITLQKIAIQKEKPLFIKKSLLEESIKENYLEIEKTAKTITSPQATQIIQESKKTFQPYAKDLEAKIKIIEDPTDKICTVGSLEEYVEYFQDRFRRIEHILRRRIDSRDAVTILDAIKATKNSKLKIICMLTEKRESKNHIILKIEDFEATATALVPRNTKKELIEKANMLMLDQVICLCVTKTKNNLLIAEDIIFPDIPDHPPKKIDEPIYAALTSDLHIGSEKFLQQPFNHFLQWLNGKLGNEAQKEIASHVKYLIIAGDIVDGIGVYPKQAKELTIKDIHKQYEVAASYIEKIPEYIEVIISPGNHDVSRKALPQPALPKEYAKPLNEARSILSLGNPCTISLHGIEFLIYHGRSLDDVTATLPNISFETPEKAMEILLRSRHLAPTYGLRTPIAPEKRDHLVIERVPDVFHAGHVHVFQYEFYRGTLIVNSGAWQEQTEYQKRMGAKPTPGIVPIVNLQTRQVIPIDFKTFP